MNRREFIRNIGNFVAGTGIALLLGRTVSANQNQPSKTEEDDTSLEMWLLSTGKDELDSNLYGFVTGEYRTYIPIVQR